MWGTTQCIPTQTCGEPQGRHFFHNKMQLQRSLVRAICYLIQPITSQHTKKNCRAPHQGHHTQTSNKTTPLFTKLVPLFQWPPFHVELDFPSISVLALIQTYSHSSWQLTTNHITTHKKQPFSYNSLSFPPKLTSEEFTTMVVNEGLYKVRAHLMLK